MSLHVLQDYRRISFITILLISYSAKLKYIYLSKNDLNQFLKLVYKYVVSTI